MSFNRKLLLFTRNDTSIGDKTLKHFIYPLFSSIDFTNNSSEIKRQYLKGPSVNYEPTDLHKYKVDDDVEISISGNLFVPEYATASNFDDSGDISLTLDNSLILTPVLLGYILSDKDNGVIGYDSTNNSKILLSNTDAGLFENLIPNISSIRYLVLATENDKMKLTDLSFQSVKYSIEAENMTMTEEYTVHAKLGEVTTDDDDDKFLKDYGELSDYKLELVRIKSAILKIYENLTTSKSIPFTDLQLSFDIPVEVKSNYLNNSNRGTASLDRSANISMTVVDISGGVPNYKDINIAGTDSFNLMHNAFKITLEVKLSKLRTKIDSGDDADYTITFTMNPQNGDTILFESLTRNYSSDGTPVFTVSYTMPEYTIQVGS